MYTCGLCNNLSPGISSTPPRSCLETQQQPSCSGAQPKCETRVISCYQQGKRTPAKSKTREKIRKDKQKAVGCDQRLWNHFLSRGCLVVASLVHIFINLFWKDRNKGTTLPFDTKWVGRLKQSSVTHVCGHLDYKEFKLLVISELARLKCDSKDWNISVYTVKNSTYWRIVELQSTSN